MVSRGTPPIDSSRKGRSGGGGGGGACSSSTDMLGRGASAAATTAGASPPFVVSYGDGSRAAHGRTAPIPRRPARRLDGPGGGLASPGDGGTGAGAARSGVAANRARGMPGGVARGETRGVAAAAVYPTPSPRRRLDDSPSPRFATPPPSPASSSRAYSAISSSAGASHSSSRQQLPSPSLRPPLAATASGTRDSRGGRDLAAVAPDVASLAASGRAEARRDGGLESSERLVSEETGLGSARDAGSSLGEASPRRFCWPSAAAGFPPREDGGGGSGRR